MLKELTKSIDKLNTSLYQLNFYCGIIRIVEVSITITVFPISKRCGIKTVPFLLQKFKEEYNGKS